MTDCEMCGETALFEITLQGAGTTTYSCVDHIGDMLPPYTGKFATFVVRTLPFRNVRKENEEELVRELTDPDRRIATRGHLYLVRTGMALDPRLMPPAP